MNNIPNQLNIENLTKTNWGQQFNKDQLEQIKIGIKNNVDVSSYVNLKYNWFQMGEIRLGLENGVDVSVYANS